MASNELVVTEFTGEIQKRILDKMNTAFVNTGKYTNDQTSISPKIWSSLVLSGGAVGTGISSAIASSAPSTLFAATAPVNTLMRYTNGGPVSSIVVDAAGKITSHAGFVPVSAMASTMSVVAPLMAMQALTTIVMLQQFSAMDKKLDAIKGSIDAVLARQEATKVAELFAAVHVVDEIYTQYDKTGRFSTDMLIRLALAEHDALSLSRRYEILENSEVSDSSAKSFDSYDTYCAMLASFLNLRVNQLRIRVDLQENPQFVQHSSENFSALLKKSIVLWDKLLHRSDKMKESIDEAATQLVNAKGLQKLAQAAKGKELSRRKEEYTAVIENERVILKDFLMLIENAKQMSESVSSEDLPSILYWRDDDGEHCITTNDPVLLTA